MLSVFCVTQRVYDVLWTVSNCVVKFFIHYPIWYLDIGIFDNFSLYIKLLNIKKIINCLLKQQKYKKEY